MSKTLRVPDYLEHNLQAIERIGRYTADLDSVGFLNNELMHDAVIRNIEIVGEASNNILNADAESAAEHHEIQWEVMYAMRNRVSHGYQKVDFEIVWKTIQGDLPVLHAEIHDVLADSLRNNDQAMMPRNLSHMPFILAWIPTSAAAPPDWQIGDMTQYCASMQRAALRLVLSWRRFTQSCGSRHKCFRPGLFNRCVIQPPTSCDGDCVFVR